jgi:DNA invertase Pin-like site-specific DNA recombinase
MMKAVIYIRVSTEDQATNGLSIENQEAKCRSYCDLHDLVPYEVIQDNGRSGKDLSRPGIQRVIELCEAGEIEDVVVYDLSRLTRSTRDLLELIEVDFHKNGINFHSIQESLDTRTLRSW